MLSILKTQRTYSGHCNVRLFISKKNPPLCVYNYFWKNTLHCALIRYCVGYTNIYFLNKQTKSKQTLGLKNPLRNFLSLYFQFLNILSKLWKHGWYWLLNKVYVHWPLTVLVIWTYNKVFWCECHPLTLHHFFQGN